MRQYFKVSKYMVEIVTDYSSWRIGFSTMRHVDGHTAETKLGFYIDLLCIRIGFWRR